MVTQDQLKAFIARQRLLLAEEREAEIIRSSLLLSNCGPKLLEQKGLLLGGLGIVSVNIGLGGKTLVELERPSAYHSSPLFPPHSFRPGDLARIEEHVSSNAPTKKAKKGLSSAVTESRGHAEGVVYKVSDTRIVIAMDQADSNTDELDLPERCRVVKLANSVTYDRMDDAIDRLEKRINGQDTNASPERLRLTQVLLGIIPPSAKVPVTDMQFFDTSLNPSQREAVKFALESPEVACIHGPPGTGKTHTLIEIIRQLTSVTPYSPKSLRLLVCGASNLSVDNILERLLALPSDGKANQLKVTRIGHPARVMARESILESTLEVQASRTDQAALAKDVKSELDGTLSVLSGKGKGAKGKKPRGAERKKLWEEVKALRKEYRQREGGVIKSVLNEAQVILATCHSSGGRQLQNYQFDVVLIDEATQALEAVCWIPIFKAQKLILAGDPMQLPPTILSTNDKKKELKGSLQKSAPKLIFSEQTKRAKDTSNKSEPVESPSPADESDSLSSSNEEDNVEGLTKATSKMSLSKGGVRPGTVKAPVLRPPKTLETTLFDRLEKMYGSGIKRMLEIQYRMHEQICSFPSKTLYSSRLKSHDSVATHLLTGLPNVNVSLAHASRKVDEDDSKEILGTPIVFFDTAGCEYFERQANGDGDEGSKSNENEALVVKNWVEQLIHAGIKPEQIAIITPYQAQVTLLTSIFRPTYGASLEIGTVDGMQGREKEAIVISLVRSNQSREVGFLKEKRRLNVAMTRARRHLCVVGDSSTVRHGGKYLDNWMSWLEANADVRYAGLE